MKPTLLVSSAVVAVCLSCSFPLLAQKAKLIVDQDARGPASTDMQSILMFAQSSAVDLLGVTIVTGDQWVKEETAHTLRALEIAGRSDVPVFAGAEYPLLNSKEESEFWENQFGALSFKGAFSPQHYHAADVIPDLPEGNPSTRARDEHAIDFIIRMVHRYPGEVTLWAGGPLTNIALAIRKDPGVVSLAKQLVLMGGGFNVENSGLQDFNGRREFNWWFDPEAVRIVLSAKWNKITITPLDVSVKTELNDSIQSQIAKVDTPLTRYLKQFSKPSYMWDEIAAAAFLDPSIITRQKELYVNIDIDHGAGYGQTLFVEPGTKVPAWWTLATVQFDLNTDKFYRQYVQLMTSPIGSGAAVSLH
jgi:inosine-uridine nucleoside N-ribohydrolase